jgi:hypothetical protein
MHRSKRHTWLRTEGPTHWLKCMKPQIEISAVITKPIHDTDIGTESDPICTVHRFNNLTRWPSATTAKINAETAA